jgi:Domain of unknown function (DUF6891)
MCLACGCEQSNGGEPWPPPLDDREVWTGEWPGVKECQEFGWYAKGNPDGPGHIPCGPHEPGAVPDLNRLRVDAEWGRQEKRYVRTTLTEAFAEMGRQGILCGRGGQLKRRDELAALTMLAMDLLKQGKEVVGYAFYTCRGKWRRQHGKDFALYFGQLKHPTLGAVGLSDAEVGRIVCECLTNQGVRHRWNDDPRRSIRVFTASLPSPRGTPQ